MNIPLFSNFAHVYSREIIAMFSDLTKTFNVGFLVHCFKRVCVVMIL